MNLKTVTKQNDNIVKLKELTNVLSSEFVNDEYEAIVKSLKKIIDEGKVDIETTENTQAKMKCYESMCYQITTILNTIKI